MPRHVPLATTPSAEPCCALATTTVTEDDAAAVAPMFKALGDPVRLRLLALITGRAEVCVCDLTGQFSVGAPTISHHLRILREAGLVSSERRGTWVYYAARPDALDRLGQLLRVVSTD